MGWSSQKTWKPFTHPTHMFSCFSHPTPRVVPVLVWWAVKGCQPQHRPAMPGFNWFWRFLSVTEVIGYTFFILYNQNTVCILYCKINHYRHIFPMFCHLMKCNFDLSSTWWIQPQSKWIRFTGTRKINWWMVVFVEVHGWKAKNPNGCVAWENLYRIHVWRKTVINSKHENRQM